MKKKPLFTIVIANYNHGKYLGEALDSIINQNYKNYELFVIDAMSTDNSVEVIKSYESKIDWWVSEKDSGQSNAFNKGFRKANGEYLFWLNADDVLLPNCLKIAANYIVENPRVNWIAANTIFFDADGLITKCTNGPSWNNFLFKNAPINIYGPTSIFRKQIFEETGGFDEKLHFVMDTDLWMRFKKKGYQFKRIHKYFWGFRIHKDSKTSHVFSEKPSSDYSKERIKILKKNDMVYSKYNLFFQKVYKVCMGLYLKSFYDTKKNRGSHIRNIKC